MENSEPTQQIDQGKGEKNSGPLIIFIVTFLLVVVAFWQFSGGKTEKRPIDSSELLKQEPVVPEPQPIEEPVIEEEPVERPPTELVEEDKPAVQEIVITLPELNESDDWLQKKLPDLTWRNELIPLLVTEDIIRRFVVFTDNFSQGLLAYEHSLFVQPKDKFSVDEQSVNVEGEKNVWQWDSKTSKRFDLYVDLLRSVDSTTLVNWYIDMKPLVDEAYRELGYEEDFTYTLQDAITRVLDMELPKSAMEVTRTSVMYKYQDPQLEALDDSDKLLLRIGKENLLIIKSVLLEINEKLAKRVDNEG
ncbi:DUF3014 domain-containing protein [Colwellia psychrerythraea]|uniref:DUF3014 domain-containing protein n=1 Tax=Colwellia psychrerythraea TaxID=28229 RepID=A0A099KU44_COLPS|nr:DUF3014 domain-containing protein [Colwellia psychrerythraea]KGJ93153.1 Protein of unknown function DUF3014 [Colwellia psychrerythraea]